MQDIQHANHLRENENSMSIRFQAGKELVKQNHFSTVDD